MPQASFLEQRRASPTSLALVVLAHAGVLGALVLVKGPEIIDAITRTNVRLIEAEKPAPPEPPKQQPERQQMQRETYTLPETPLRPIETDGPTTIRLPPVPPEPYRPPVPPVEIRTETIIPRIVSPRRARANLGSYFSTDDYPAAALRAEAEGRTSFSLAIGTDGRVTNCTVTGSSGNSALDGATCRILRGRARYTPARDQNGNATSGADRGTITWRLPSE